MIKITLPDGHYYDEMLTAQGEQRQHYNAWWQWFRSTDQFSIRQKKEQAELLFHRIGITFNVYGEDEGTERLIPFDSVPRIIPAGEWQRIDRGIRQRVKALNAFLYDIYHDQNILRAGLIPAEQVLANEQYQPCMQGINLPNNTYAHITGVDMVRNSDGQYYVLEDNLRTPSGVSYMLENRKMMMRLYPEMFEQHRIAPVERYPSYLLQTLRESSPVDDPCVVVMTPGRFNSAYFEHSFLAQQMGVELVESADLFIKTGAVYMRTTEGPRRVDVIYRRIDDAYLDPLAFRADSMLGVPGLLSVYRAGGVVLANAIGTGVADDKSIYPFVPEMIRFYLGEQPILSNIPTWQCRKAEDLSYVLSHLELMVVKEVHGAGGYGMLVGPRSTKEEREAFRQRLLANPANYIAQDTLALSTCPTFIEEGLAPRHIDLRPFVLSGQEIRLVPGGLTRVALTEGSLVVNSSQGGGTKDTWKLSMIPRHSQQSRDLALPLNLSLTHELFQARHARFTMSNLLNFFALDGNNPYSIFSCVEMAWNNAHAVRGSLSAEVWESINATRIELRKLRQQGIGELGNDAFFEWVKERVHLFRGAILGTLLRNDALSFIGIGTLIERASATAQLLLIKDQQLNSDPDPVREYYRLDTLLNAVSAREAYNSIYRQPVSRETVMELLILRNDVPRSLRASISDLVGQLEQIANDRSHLPLRLAHQLNVDLRFSTRDDLAQADLQVTLNALLARINALSDSIRQTYLEAL